MTIVTSSYRPKRAPKKKRPRSYPADMPVIVTPAPMKQRKQPVTRLRDQEANNNDQEPQPKRSAIVEPKRKSNSMLAHLLDDITDEECNRRADLAEAMFREIKRRAALPESD